MYPHKYSHTYLHIYLVIRIRPYLAQIYSTLIIIVTTTAIRKILLILKFIANIRNNNKLTLFDTKFCKWHTIKTFYCKNKMFSQNEIDQVMTD